MIRLQFVHLLEDLLHAFMSIYSWSTYIVIDDLQVDGLMGALGHVVEGVSDATGAVDLCHLYFFLI